MASSMAHLGIARRVREFRVMKAWTEAVGEAISRRTRPARLMGDTLYVDVSGPAWMTELRFQKAVIVERLNEVLKERAVTDIVFRPGEVKDISMPGKGRGKKTRTLGPGEREFIDRTVSGIKDAGLRETIRRALERAKTGG